MPILIAGSSGLLGRALTDSLLADGVEVRRLVRPDSPGEGIPWDPASGVLPKGALDGVDVVVNLAGRSIGERRWSDKEKRALWDSRVGTTRLLAEAIAQSAQLLELAAEKPSALLCFEREPRHCHRTLLLGAVAPDVEIVDLFA